MSTNIGINGFGRIGRQLFRASFEFPDVAVVAINDPFMDVEYIAHAMRFDTTMGPFKGTIEIKTKNLLYVDGRKVAVSSCSDPSQIPWADHNVSYVVESSGVYTTTERAASHLAGGAQRVVITAPSADAPTFMMGCNDDAFKPATQVFSAGSCTAAALAPPLKLLHQHFGVAECTFTTVHGATSQQRMVDGTNAQDYRLGRSAHDNVIPCATTAVKSVIKVLPKLAGRVAGMAIRVPTSNVCLLDVTVNLERAVSKLAVDSLFRNDSAAPAAATPLPPAPTEDGATSPSASPSHPPAGVARPAAVVGFTADPVVSSDFNRDSHACVYDSTASLVLHKNVSLSPDDATALATNFKLLFWYDNEAGYVHQVLSLIVSTSTKW